MNDVLAKFLKSLVQNPDLLDAFNDLERREQVLAANQDLTEADKLALGTGESGTILRQLNASPDDVSWVIAPGIKKSMVAFGIKNGPPIPPPLRSSGKAASKARSKASTRRPAKKSKPRKKSKG